MYFSNSLTIHKLIYNIIQFKGHLHYARVLLQLGYRIGLRVSIPARVKLVRVPFFFTRAVRKIERSVGFYIIYFFFFNFRFWEMLAYLANTLIFIMVGVVIMEKALSEFDLKDGFLIIVDYLGISVIRYAQL